MKNRLSTYVTGRDNNFNLIRFIAASLVLITHSFALVVGSDTAEPLRLTLDTTWGVIAVDIFFVTSGFLITSSYFSRKNLIAFVWARILRIYPALVVAVLFCTFVVGLWFTTLSTQDYLLSTEVHGYVIKNSTLFFGINWNLPSVFLDNPWPRSINSSLWTLPYEVKMYAILAVTLGIVSYLSSRLKWVNFKSVMLLLGLVSLGLHLVNHFYSILPEQFMRLFSMFFMGSMFYVWRDKIYLSPKLFFPALALLFISMLNKDTYYITYYLFLPFIIFYIAYIPSGVIRNFNKMGDYSYGLYIYAFPVQQSIIALISDISIIQLIVLSFIVTFVLAYLSWHLVEKKCLMMKKQYIIIEEYLLNFVK